MSNCPECNKAMGLHDLFIAGLCPNCAGKYITQQAKRIEGLEAENRWIPVSERLPKEKGYISVADAQLKIPQVWYWTNTHDEANRLKVFYSHWKPVILPEQARKGK